MPLKFFSDDYRDYLDDVPQPKWHERKAAPVIKSSAAGGVGILIGLIVAWSTELREAPAGIIGGVGAMLAYDFYWRWIRDALPRPGRYAKAARMASPTDHVVASNDQRR